MTTPPVFFELTTWGVHASCIQQLPTFSRQCSSAQRRLCLKKLMTALGCPIAGERSHCGCSPFRRRGFCWTRLDSLRKWQAGAHTLAPDTGRLSGRNSHDIAASASTVRPPASTNGRRSITKLDSLCGSSSVQDSAVSSHSNSTGSDQPPCAGGRMTRHFGSSAPVRAVRGDFACVFRASAMASRSPNARGRSATTARALVRGSSARRSRGVAFFLRRVVPAPEVHAG
jgi:hypothetical protein